MYAANEFSGFSFTFQINTPLFCMIGCASASSASWQRINIPQLGEEKVSLLFQSLQVYAHIHDLIWHLFYLLIVDLIASVVLLDRVRAVGIGVYSARWGCVVRARQHPGYCGHHWRRHCLACRCRWATSIAAGPAACCRAGQWLYRSRSEAHWGSLAHRAGIVIPAIVIGIEELFKPLQKLEIVLEATLD